MKLLMIVAIVGSLIANSARLHAQDSLNVTRVGQIGYWGHPRDVAVSNQFAYVAAENSGLRVVDISNEIAPFEVGYCETPGQARGVTLSGAYAYVADLQSGLRVINVSNPAAPHEVGAYTGSTVYSVLVSGELALVAGEGLRILDIGNPAAPQQVSTFETNGSYWDVAIAGELAYCAAPGAGLRIIDFSNPASPWLVGYDSSAASARAIALAGPYAVIACWDSVRIYDISNPQSPQRVSAWDPPGWAVGVSVAGNLVYVACSYAGMQIFDISNPASPVPVSQVNDPIQGVEATWIAANRCYTVGHGFSILNVSQPALPQVLVARFGDLGMPVALAARGEHVLVADDADSWLHVLSVANPALPHQVDSAWIGCQPTDLVISGNFGYVTCGAGLRVYDLTDPVTPEMVGSYYVQQCHGLAVSGSHVFVASISSGFYVFDVSDPAAPALVDSLTLTTATDVALAGSYALVTQYNAGRITVVDLSDPGSVTPVATVDVPFPWSITVNGGRAYVAAVNGLVIFDIANPQTPQLLGNYACEQAVQVAVSGQRAVVAAMDAGLIVLDVENPATPGLAGFYNTPGFCRSVVLVGDLVYVADDTYFGVYRIGTPSSVSDPSRTVSAGYRLEPCYPNPFNVVVSIPVTVTATAHLSVDIVDVQGRVVRTVVNDVLGPGYHVWRFHAAGLSSGTYFVRARQSGRSTMQKVLLLK